MELGLSEREPAAAATRAGLVLMYHRISSTAADPWALGVSPEHFEAHLQIIRRSWDATPLREIANPRRPGRAIAVTFDDGYVDNLRVAAPLLARYEIPATVFVATGYVDARREFWWDELERILLSSGELPPDPVPALEDVAAPLLESGRHYPSDDRATDKAWIATKTGVPSPRFAFFREVHGQLMLATDGDRRVALERIARWAGDPGFPRTSLLCVSADELRQLAGNDMVDIGAHTVTHPKLPALSATEQAQEIAQSKADVESHIGTPPVSFSYPYGFYSADTVRIARDAGFSLACSTQQRAVAVDCDPFLLPRIKIGDWCGEAFEAVLANYCPAA